MKADKLSKRIVELIFEKKGYDVKVIDLQPVSSIADYFIICSADSDTQVRAIADNIDKALRDEGIKLWHKEGYTALNWVLIDYVDVVVHVFKHESRLFYNLEKLWGDAPVKSYSDPALKKTRTRKKAVKTEPMPEGE